MSSQRCRWCGLDADLAPSISMNGMDREHTSRTRLSDGCMDAMLAEIKALRERVAALERDTRALDARTIGDVVIR